MSVSAYILQEPGTVVTPTITLASLSSTTGTGRQSAKIDLGAHWAPIYDVYFQSEVAAAPTTGNTIDLYWSASDSGTAGTDNAGEASGTDAAYKTASVTPQYAPQLIFVGSLVLSNDAGGSNAGTNTQQAVFSFAPPLRYGQFIVMNNSGQTLSSNAGSHVLSAYPLPAELVSTITG